MFKLLTRLTTVLVNFVINLFLFEILPTLSQGQGKNPLPLGHTKMIIKKNLIIYPIH